MPSFGTRTLGPWIGGFLLVTALAAQDVPKAGTPPKTPAKGLQPLVADTLDQAIERAASRELPVLLAVGVAGQAGYPPVFLDPTVARASRSVLVLASAEFTTEDPFFKSRRFPEDQAPCFLILDGYGNVLSRLGEKSDSRILLATARSAGQQISQLKEELPKVLARARELSAAKDERAFLELARPWAARHLRGYPEVRALHELFDGFGKARLKQAAEAEPEEALRTLEAMARDYEGSPPQALALVAAARLQEEKLKNRDEAKRLLKRVVDELPWPENAEANEQARAMLARFRQDDIRRRLEEIEKKKKEEKK